MDVVLTENEINVLLLILKTISSFSVLICAFLDSATALWDMKRIQEWASLEFSDWLFVSLIFNFFFLSSDIKPNILVPISCCFASMHQTVFHVEKYTVSWWTAGKYAAECTNWNQNAFCNFG